MPAEEKKITLPIGRFIDSYLVGTADKRFNVHPDDALILSLQDKDEQYCHVEFPSPDNSLDKPCVWKIKEWRTASIKRERDKAKYEEERLAANIFRENVERVAKRIASITGLDVERVRGTAIHMVRQADRIGLEKLGIKIEEWDKKITLGYIK